MPLAYFDKDCGQLLTTEILINLKAPIIALSAPVSPSLLSCIRCRVNSCQYHWLLSLWQRLGEGAKLNGWVVLSLPTPSGFSRSCSGPAPKPSIEIQKLWTRSLDIKFLSGQQD